MESLRKVQGRSQLHQQNRNFQYLNRTVILSPGPKIRLRNVTMCGHSANTTLESSVWIQSSKWQSPDNSISMLSRPFASTLLRPKCQDQETNVSSVHIRAGPPSEPSCGVEGDLSTIQRGHCCNAEAMPVHERTQGCIAVCAQEGIGFVTPISGAACSED